MIEAHATEEALLAAAREGDERAFERLVGPHRRELMAHCYRMVGSLQDAEDLVQETYLRAWRSCRGFEGRSSVRAWLYQIATNRCLTALAKRDRRRRLPSGVAAPDPDPIAFTVQPATDVDWLEPIPDAMVMPRRPTRRPSSRRARGCAWR